MLQFCTSPTPRGDSQATFSRHIESRHWTIHELISLFLYIWSKMLTPIARYTSTAPSAADQTASDIAAATGVKAKAYKANVVNQEEIESVMELATQELGSGVLDIVVANAGIATHYAAEEYSVAQWKEVMDVNLNGAFYTAQAAGRIFKRQWEGRKGQGSLVFTGSVSAVLVNVPQKQSAYNASKAAVVQLARCLSVEWVGWCRVNVVSPVSSPLLTLSERILLMFGIGIHCYR